MLELLLRGRIWIKLKARRFISLTLTTTAGKMMAGNSLQSSELTLEEILQVALREIGSDVTKTAANMQFLRMCSTQFDLHLG